MEKGGYVYIMTNHNHTVLYTGVTSNLVGRVFQHREKLVKGFTSRYNLTKLVWYEKHSEITNAITREKQIKAGSRARKVELINAMNPEWSDLYGSIIWYPIHPVHRCKLKQAFTLTYGNTSGILKQNKCSID